MNFLDLDAVIVGAGPAGSATAALLAGRGQSVLLCDAARFPRSKPCAEYISPGGVAILESLGVFAHLDVHQTGRWLRGMSIVGRNGRSHTVTYQSKEGRELRGLSVPRSALDAALVEVARERGAVVRDGYRIRGIRRDGERVTGVVGADGETISARLVVGADGLNSIVARHLGVSRRPMWPRRLGLVAHVANVPWPEDTGVMFVGRHSYVGAGPLDNRGLATVGLVRPMPRGRLGSPSLALEEALRDFPHLAARLASATVAGPVRGVGPLARSARSSAGPGYVLVGDAAGFFDPFTGEGIFRALRSAQLAAAYPSQYSRARRAAFASKEQLTRMVQVLVRVPELLDFGLRRLEQRPAVARRLGNMLGDIEPARPSIVWQLLGP